jgi:type VI secretion system protein ImpF
LRSYVLRDLTWLFNTTNMASMVDLSAHPEVAKSVLNYGLPDLAGHTVSSMDVPEVEQLLRRAIWNYEPRLIQRTVKVRVTVDPNIMNHNSVSFAIDAELFAQPLPQQLYMRTEIDFEDGEVKIALREQSATGKSERPGRG